jgi:AcrR family transcriptional regulator
MATVAPAERSARERILDTASELFYRDGYHAVGIDTIIAASGVAKMTLYRHFASKDELIAAYLERSNAEFMAWLEEAASAVDEPRAKLLAAFDAIGKLATSARCLGCTFQGAASEFPELDHPGHRVALDHKRAVIDRFAGLAREAGLRDPDRLAAQLLLLMDGAWVAARMFGSDNHAGSVAEAARVLIGHHAGGGRLSGASRSPAPPVASPAQPGPPHSSQRVGRNRISTG